MRLLWLCVVASLVASAAALSLPLQPRKLLSLTPVLVYKHATLEEALALPPADSAAVLVVGVSRPTRRHSSQPVLSFSRQAAAHIPLAVQQLLVSCMQQLVQLGCAGGFSLQLDLMPDSWQGSGAAAAPYGSTVPLLVFDASSGRVLLSRTLLRALQHNPLHVAAAASSATAAAAHHLQLLAGQVLPSTLSQLMAAAPAAAAAGLAAGLLGPVPRWFCFMCPIVLGLLAPLVINAGVGEAADLACRSMQLPDDECVELWFAALGLGMVLSLLSAIPIYKVCHLYDCAHPHPNTTLARM